VNIVLCLLRTDNYYSFNFVCEYTFIYYYSCASESMKKKQSKKEQKPEVIKLSLFGKPEETQHKKRAVIQKDVGPKAEGPLPYFGEKHPKYAYAQHETPVPPGSQQIPPQYGEPVQPTVSETAPPTSSPGMGLFITGFIIFITIIFVLLTMNDDNGSGFSNCPTRCDGAAIIIDPECSCPSDSKYHSTISNKQCIGCKQCVCR